MNEDAIEYLGRLIAKEIRDSAISNLDRYISGEAKGRHANFVREKINENQHDTSRLMDDMIPIIVDETIDIFLQVLDENIENLKILVNERGSIISPYNYTDALEAEYLPEDGWIKKYSTQRRVEPDSWHY